MSDHQNTQPSPRNSNAAISPRNERSDADLIEKGHLIEKNMGHFATHQDDNVPLKNMDNQLQDMDQDYNVMLLERIESKKQLEAKFQDIQRKIQANRDFTRAEEKRVQDTLMAFRSRFEHNLRSLKEEFEEKIRKMREFNREDFKNATQRLDNLEHSIEQEISDRMTETDATIGETQDKLNQLQADFDGEVATRIEEEKNIMQTLDDTKYELHKKIDNERTDKSLSLGHFKDTTLAQLKRQHKYVEEFQVEAMKEFARLRETLEHEMSERFENQDEILDNLSMSIKTFQDTMKIVQETVC